MTRLFCNDLCVINALYPQGLPADIEIMSESPNINLEHKATSINDRCSPQQLVELAWDIHHVCAALYKSLSGAGYEADSYAIMFALTCEQNFLKKAAFLNEEDFTNPAIVTVMDGAESNPRVSNHYALLLRDHKDCQVEKFKPEDIETTDHFFHLQGARTENKIVEYTKAFASNVYSYPLVTPLWPVLKRLWHTLAFARKPSIALIEESQISRAICTHLSFRGHGFEFIKAALSEQIKKDKKTYEADAEKRFADIKSIIDDEVKTFIDKNVTPSAQSTVYDYLQEKIHHAHQQYYISYRASEKLIAERMGSTRAVLSNMLKSPTEYGFAFACRDKNIKVFTFQHGICREISPHFDYIPQITESNIPHYFITNTKKAAEVSVGFPFSKAETVPVGMTKDHRCGKRHVPHPDFPDIFYISTNVYTGNAGFIKAGGDDKTAVLSEMNTIQNILAKVDKDILYKAYPTQKYLDPDPCYDEVIKHKNLQLYLEEKDLRYLSKHAKVLISSKATSTFNWCFLTEKPFIFLDHPALAPLRKELVPIFKNMLFYFDLSEEGIEAEIVDLLNKPVEDIEALYNAPDKAAERARFISEYYFEEKTGAEKRACDFIKKTVFS